jgi:heme O synthase-like polyprenyltransferase
MNKLNVFKFGTRLIVGVGTTSIAKSIIRNNVAPSNRFEAISIAVASVVIGSMASTATKDYTDAQIDEVVEAWKKLKQPSSEEPAPTA